MCGGRSVGVVDGVLMAKNYNVVNDGLIGHLIGRKRSISIVSGL